MILFIGMCTLSFSQQQHKIDSLTTILDTQISDKERVDVLVELAYYHFTYDNQKAQKYGETARDLASSINYSEGLFNAYGELAHIFLNQDNYPKTIEYCDLIIKNEKIIDDYKVVMKAYHVLSYAYQGLGDFSERTKNRYHSLRIAEKNGDKEKVKEYKKIIAANDGSVEKLQGILPIFHEDILIKEKAKDSIGLINQYQQISFAYMNLDSLEKALYYQEKALKFTQLKNQFFYENVAHYVLAEIQLELGNINKAQDHTLKAIEICQKHGFTDGLISHYRAMSNLLRVENRLSPARDFLEKGLKAAHSINSKKQLQSIYKELYQLDTLAGNYKQAFEHFNQFVEYRDSTSNLNVERKIMMERSQYEKEKAIALERFAHNERNTRNIGIVIILAILTVFIYDFIKNRLQKRKLNEQVNAQTKEIRLQKEKLESLNHFKTLLFTNITHELRTPLTVILGMTQRIMGKDKGFSLSLIHKDLNLILRNGNKLHNLINQILDLAKVDNNQMAIDYYQDDIVGYIKYIAESFHSYANAQNILLTVESQVPKLIMDFDFEKTRQIISNLLSNAIKYTSSGENIIIQLEKDTSAKNLPSVIIKVKDNGRGIPSKDLPYIFDRFYQAEDDIAKSGGSGIGLALTKELIHLLNGDISVDSTLNVGTTFTIILPITNDAPFKQAPQINTTNLSNYPTDTESPLQAIPLTSQPSLLIIEDNGDVVAYLKSCLSNSYQLQIAYNGRIGVEMALDKIPDIIISDVMMPEKDGLEVCEILKNDERTSHIPIILLTAKADVKSRIDGLKRGADAYLAKPFDLEELLVLLNQLVILRQNLKRRYSGFDIPQNDETSTESGTSPNLYKLEDAFFLKAKDIIEENIANADFSPQVLAKEMGMSYSVLYRKLTALTERSPSLFIRYVRLEHAKKMLLQSDDSIATVAYNVGFSDPRFFSRVFAKEFQLTPSKFRNQVL